MENFHNEVFHDLYSLLRWSNKGGWEGQDMKHEWGMGNAYTILVEKPEAKRRLEDIDIDGRITLKWILQNIMWGCGLVSASSGQSPVAVTVS